MASWLKAAEDLFEVVDRRAKLVVSELSDEQSDSQPPASNGQGTQAKKLKPKRKAQKRLSLNESSSAKTTAQEQSSNLTTQVDVIPEREISDSINEDEKTPFGRSTIPANNKQQQDIDKEDNGPSSNSFEIEVVKTENDRDHIKAPPVLDLEVVSNLRNELDDGNATSVHEEEFLSLPSKRVEGVGAINGDHLNEDEQSNKSGAVDAPAKLNWEGSESVATDPQSISETQSVVVHETEPVAKQNKKPENLPDQSSVKVQDQLDEAQGLLETAISTGQSKEARLARVCAGLSSRLQEYKSENAQLEELLTAEKELSKSFEARIKQLQEDLFASKNEITRIESNMVEALVAKNSEIENLSNSMDALKKQTVLSEGNLVSIQANMDAVMRNRELTETRMMQALREELTSAERRAEEERAAHHATKMAAMEREVDLEHRALESSSALARTQRIADERTLKVTELEQKVALLEVECASLNQELQDLEARARRGQKKSPDEANQLIQMQAWQEEVERARQGQRDAESKLSSLEAEVQKMRVEMAAMKRDAEHYSRQEHIELEKRYRELTDLLYYKQTQLEAMTSEKAAAKFQLEKEIMRHQEAQVEVEVERSRASRRATTSWEEDTEMKALEPLPLHHRHMSGASMQLQKAAKLLDSGAVRATRFLWRYPIARLMLLFYLVFVHLFLMYLLHRLQEQADRFAAKEVAESMGLSNNQLP